MGLRRLLHGLLAALFLSIALIPTARAPVTGVTVATDRTDYVAGMAVTATAAIAYSGSFPQIDEPARVEWRNATWVLALAEYVPKTRITGSMAEAVAVWTPPAPGIYHVNVTSNATNGTPPRVSGTASFTVWSANDYVIARGVRVATDRRGYEAGELVTASANFTTIPGWVLGNVSRLERVEFNWYYPSGAPARLAVVVNVAAGEAVDVWTPDLVGSLYTVSASYLGNDSVSNATGFPVFPSTTLAGNVSAGQSVIWDAGQSPWRVCGDLLVTATGTLTIEPNVTVKFCRGSRLIVQGLLWGNGSPAAPITLTSYEFPPAPGDWNGVRFEGLTSSLLANAVVEFVRDGIVALGSSPLLGPIILREGVGEALNLTDSSATVNGVTVTGFSRGVHARDSPGSLTNVTISGAAREGIYVEGLAPVFRDVRVVGGNYSVRAVLVGSLQIVGAVFAAAAIRAVDLTGTTVTIANGTIASAGQDFLLIASTATLLNCTFVDDPIERQIITPSRLIVQNFLAVDVRTPGGAPVAGAAVAVTKNGPLVLSRTTDAGGIAAWIVIEDRVYNATAVTKNRIEVRVTKPAYSVEGARVVDMATSHAEAFVATPLGTGTPAGMDLRVFLVGLLSVALLACLLVVWRRRSSAEAASDPADELPVVPPLETTPGSSYAILGERPDAAFARFVADVRSGAPGMCITRIHPEGARKRYGLDGIPVFWLSRSFSKETLNPTNLGAIVELVRKYTEDKSECRVLLDGVEYLYTQNDFGKIAKFVQALADVVAEKKAILLIPLDPRIFDEDRLAILLRDLKSWP